jgi:hypothetical protein
MSPVVAQCSTVAHGKSVKSPANLKRARAFFERALALDPGDIDALLGRASVDLEKARGYSGGDRAAYLAAAEAALTRL